MSTTPEKQSPHVHGFPIKQIVLAVNLSARSENTVAYAIAIARSFGARIHLAYAPAPPWSSESSPHGGHEYLEEKSHEPAQELTDLCKRTRRIYPNCGADLGVGNCTDEVSELARMFDADLIITASHETSFLNSLFNFDQSPKIMHRAPCPVLVYCDEKN